MTNPNKLPPEIKGIRDLMAKWLACIVENGEPYDDFENMDWSELVGNEAMGEAFKELVTDFCPKLTELGAVMLVSRELFGSRLTNDKDGKPIRTYAFEVVNLDETPVKEG